MTAATRDKGLPWPLSRHELSAAGVGAVLSERPRWSASGCGSMWGVPLNVDQCDVFFAEVTSGWQVWAAQNADGLPAVDGPDGMRSVPFWSTSDRAEQAIASAGFLAGCVAVGIDPDLWRVEWLAEWADSSEVRVTLNWNPNTSVGCEMTAAEASERMRETPRPSHPPTIPSATDDPVASRLAVGFVHKTFFRARTQKLGDLVVPTGVAHALDVTVGNPALCGVHLAVTLEGATWPDTDARLCPTCSKLAIGNT